VDRLHHVAIFTADYAATSSWAPARLHHFAVQARDLDEFVAVRERLLARGACGEEVIDFGMHVSLLATDPDGGMVEVLVPPGAHAELPFAVTPH
jgi:hypothetical protein